MTLYRYLLQSFRYYRRANVAVALGVAVATAVLTGALLVGDSVRGSLRSLTLQRLGQIDQALTTPLPFRRELASELAAADGFDQHYQSVVPVLSVNGSLAFRSEEGRRFASGLSIHGIDKAFSSLGTGGPQATLDDQSIVITKAVAVDLGVSIGEEVVLRVPTISTTPADSPLGERSETTSSKRLTVTEILPAQGLARYGLQPSQLPPRNVFVQQAMLAELVDQPGEVNTLVVSTDRLETSSPKVATDWLAANFRPQLDDYGVFVEQVNSQQIQIEGTQLVLPPTVANAAETAFASTQRVSTYLANSIKSGERSIPYSTVSGVDFNRTVGPLSSLTNNPFVDEKASIVLNRWAADELQIEVGDSVTLTFYEPESTHGELIEATPASFTLRAIVDLESSGGPTPAFDKRLTPKLEGVTDAESISDWELPFELVEKIRTQDETYWDDYGTTPKAFIDFELAEKLWGSRWGATSAIRVKRVDEATTADTVEAELLAAIKPAELGFVFQPVKAQGLAASSGSTPFDGLFFGFSLFLIAASLMLIALLFRLAIERRSKEVGLLEALGWPASHVRKVLAGEGLVVALLGAAIGLPLGILYAWLMITGLQTLWVEAIVTPFLTLHVRLVSLLIGGLVGVGTAWLTFRRTLGRMIQQSERRLLAGGTMADAKPIYGKAANRNLYVIGLLLLGSIGIGFYGSLLQAEAQAGAFFASGALVLVALLLACRQLLSWMASSKQTPGSYTLTSLGRSNLARSPSRSLLMIGLVAAASFLVIAIAAFRLAPSEEGTGGFDLLAVTDQPLHYDLNTEQGHLELGFRPRDEAILDQHRFFAFRVHGGEDASCLNLYQTQQPRVLGVSEAFIERGRFAFADHTERDAQKSSPWQLLQQPGEAVPVILDFNTAMYSLKLYGVAGSTFTIRDEFEQPRKVVVVGLLKNSILQGDLLMADERFRELFPTSSGARLLLAERVDTKTNTNDQTELATLLEDRLSNYGLDAVSTEKRLAGFLAVQNTYLSTFQTLGFLGLLLGAVGVAVVQLRNVEERRSELALLRAIGIDGSRTTQLVLSESITLLLAGAAIGGLAALVALMPQAWTQSMQLPLLSAFQLVGWVLLVGVGVGYVVTRQALRAPVIGALRGE